jgi:hypothetical protein
MQVRQNSCDDATASKRTLLEGHHNVKDRIQGRHEVKQRRRRDICRKSYCHEIVTFETVLL